MASLCFESPNLQRDWSRTEKGDRGYSRRTLNPEVAGLGPTSFPGSLFFPPPEARRGGKKRDPVNEVGSSPTLTT